MDLRQDLEIKISERLTTLTAEKMQRLAEEYVWIQYPERFPRFDFRAFSAEGKSRAGWPDAFIIRDGLIDGVEATIAKKKEKVKKHIQEDIEKARQKSPFMAGFVFISGNPNVQFDTDELLYFKQAFIKAGIPSERCELIFGMSLARELAKPEFALLIHSILHLPISPAKFSFFNPNLTWERNRHLFIPSVEDYNHGRVHRPQVADEVLHILDQNGLVLVKGIGASGKTVLARLLALDVASQGLPSYYLDFARFDERFLSGGDLARDMDDFGGQGVLFILDNVHLNESVASELASHWELLITNQRPNLLLLGRELRSNRGSPIAGLKIPMIPLKARHPEVLGVYLRLIGRDNVSGCSPLQPPIKELDQWIATFGGDPFNPETTTDLISFSAALLNQLDALRKGHWTLTEQHAVDGIREHYLDKLTKEETGNLMRLAAMSELEFYLVQEGLADQRAKLNIACYRLGLVFQNKVFGHTSYRLAHTALGRLLLKASYEPVKVIKEQIAAALAYPFSGFAIARRMEALGQVEQAKAVLSALMADPKRLLELSACHYLHLALRQIQAHEITNFYEITSVLCHANYRGRLTQMALATPLHFLTSFLAYTEETEALKSVFTDITNALAESCNREALMRQVLATPLNGLKSFLAYCQRKKALRPVFITLVSELGKSENSALLAKRFATESIDHILGVIKVKKTVDLWQPVFEAVDISEWQQNRLTEPASKVWLFEFFRTYAVMYGRPELLQAPALNIIRHPSKQDWHTQPVGVSNPVGLNHLSHVLRCASDVSLSEISHFLDVIATGSWVDKQFDRRGKTGFLAGALLSLALVLPDQQRRYFLRPSLEQKVRRELVVCHSGDCSACAEGISLLGAAALLGLRIDTMPLPNLVSMDLNSIIELRKLKPGLSIIGPLQVQFWLGLRELARLCKELGSISGTEAEKILELWRELNAGENGQALSIFIRQNNALMISWLERCQAAGWCLLAPQPLRIIPGQDAVI